MRTYAVINSKTTVAVNQSYQGETLEQKMRRVMSNKEPISDGAPLLYTERQEGVRPEYNIRTDRFELAIEATDTITKSHLSKREERAKLKALEGGKKGEDTIGGAEPIQGTK